MNGPDEPPPDGALMIRGIARAQVAEVARLVIGMARRQRAQADGREQFGADFSTTAGPARFVEHGMAQRNGEQLVGPARGIIPVFAVHDVEQVAALCGPEAAVERFARARDVFGERPRGFLAALLAQPALEQAQRIVPERVDLDGFSAARRHHPAIHLRVHPGELISLPRPAAAARPPDRRRCRSACRASGARRCRGASAAAVAAWRGRRSSRRSDRARGRTRASRPPCGRGPRASPSGNIFGIRPSRM